MALAFICAVCETVPSSCTTLQSVRLCHPVVLLYSLWDRSIQLYYFTACETVPSTCVRTTLQFVRPFKHATCETLPSRTTLQSVRPYPPPVYLLHCSLWDPLNMQHVRPYPHLLLCSLRDTTLKLCYFAICETLPFVKYSEETLAKRH